MPLVDDRTQKMIDALAACAASCAACSKDCASRGDGDLAACIALCNDCAVLCGACVPLIASGKDRGRGCQPPCRGGRSAVAQLEDRLAALTAQVTGPEHGARDAAVRRALRPAIGNLGRYRTDDVATSG